MSLVEDKINLALCYQSQTLEEILLGYTRDAAYAEHMEHVKGILKEGYLADVVMLAGDIRHYR